MAIKMFCPKNKLCFEDLAAFTLAEILLSLTVIGIVAAIALPSLLGNANERAWETQKKALYTRFSQALPLLPSLNGYGQLEGTLSSNSDDGKQHVDTDTAAETFIRDGLSKVMKITNICDSEHLADCGLPDKIIPIDGGTAKSLSAITSLAKFNDKFSGKIEAHDSSYEQLDTNAAAFETVNGESILVYYNPNCISNMMLSSLSFSQPKMCANFVYDLNGKKGPNTVGKDIGFITALYSTDPIVVAPNPYPNDLSTTYSGTEAQSKCREMNDEAKLPNLEEMMSLFYNKTFLGDTVPNYWSSTIVLNKPCNQGFASGMNTCNSTASDKLGVRCIKR